MSINEQAAAIVAELEHLYPDVACTLDFRTPHELLVGAILAAQCTDVRVNQVTQALFARFPTPADYVAADRREIEELIRSCGLFRNKAKAIQQSSQVLVDAFNGQVPQTLNELTSLPGIGRKIANLILGDCFGQQAVVVDTHCARISKLLGLTEQSDPAAIEKGLVAVLPPDKQTAYGHLVVTLGREICIARRPQCDICPLKPLCRYGRST
jgi:endonuclease-3